MIIASLGKLLEDELKDLYSAETQLVKALPKLAKKATNGNLKAAFHNHLEETKNQVERLTKIGEILGIKMSGKKCKAMEGLIEEGKEILESDGSEALIDAALIGAAQRVEHYEMAGYGVARAFAEHLEHSDVVQLLTVTLEEEAAADEKLTHISLKEILPATTAEGEEGETMEQEEEEVAATSRRRC